MIMPVQHGREQVDKAGKFCKVGQGRRPRREALRILRAAAGLEVAQAMPLRQPVVQYHSQFNFRPVGPIRTNRLDPA